MGVLILSSLVIFGWLVHLPELIQVHKSLVPMQFNTAVCFFLCAIGLLLIYFQKGSKIVVGIALTCGLISLLTLSQYIFGVNIGIDELLLNHQVTVKTSHAGRMGPNTAICFFLSSIVLLIDSDFRNHSVGKKIWGAIISTVILGLGLVALVGYATQVESVYGWGKYTNMAVHTAVGFLLIGGFFTFKAWSDEEGKLGLMHNFGFVLAQSVVLAAVLLVIDISVPLGVATGILYAVLVIYSWLFQDKRLIIIMGIAACVLTILGFLYSPATSEDWKAIINRSLTVVVITGGAILLYEIKKKREELSLINQNLEVILDARTEQLRIKNAELERFVYVASHDLQEPLRTITTLLQRLNDGKFGPEQEPEIRTFTIQAAQRMHELIKSLLDYSQIGTDMDIREINSEELLDQVCKDLSLSIENSQANVKCNTPHPIKGDAVLIRLLFQNLIGNAIKFAQPNKPPEIEISSELKNNQVIFKVKDNGIGIAPENQEKVFQFFQRLHHKDEYEGSGIGLSHCHKIVDLHNGSIWLESVENNGTSFFISLNT